MSAALDSLPFAITRIGEARGEPVVVLPGGPCRGPEYLGDLAGIDEVRPLVVLHPRGTPRSGGLSRGWWADADDVLSLIDALGLEAADLISHSAGTRLALATAARFAGRIRSMALLTPPASWLTGVAYDGNHLPADRDDPVVAAAISSLAEEGGNESDEEFRAAFLRQAPASYAHWTPTEQAHAAVGSMSVEAATAWFEGIPDHVTESILAASMPPALVVGGDRDLLTGVQPVLAYATALGADATLIADCGHYPWVEQPIAFREVLAEWLARRGSDESHRPQSSEEAAAGQEPVSLTDPVQGG
ncbi:MAG TPA: alpha/beta hydrolase [Microbacterium sp.]|nr:alpha/beta hydrolase [Microbacterium sp.]